MKRKVLLALADPSAGERLRLGLEEAGYEVAQHRNGKETVRYLEDEFPDLVLLGTDLPDLSAGEILQQVGRFAAYPLILLLREWNTDEVVSGFAAGANDVVSIDVPIAELYARAGHLIAMFKRIGDGSLTELSYGDLRMELKSRKVYRGDEEVKLTPKEFDLLLFLLKRAGKVCGREMILQQVWGYDFAAGTNVVDVYIRHLRKKIDRGQTQKLLHTVRGTGYMLQ
ncbi:response regulator transcription factor [Paenibacillus macerans]|uniref:Response regulator n=1 Tax=Paenibacillus macerans TaxID=44252 RepID=A0A090ZXD1_PAEMA|nr:response regulator transcription factor [Paenibacillus macerans]KFN08786.1 response regulator [Paenibacillus macerans]MCY7562151.1 response regulator transcription factor [Paenibacillus macerans]MEC0140513.1 response regulator transcription factor [Paenibacillus macerans]MEC0153781.1 response regulator transcription factor [Paenibacillus macerans]MEC0330677.1 response regulator transcription factor [Paenibacillus macerans]